VVVDIDFLLAEFKFEGPLILHTDILEAALIQISFKAWES